MADRETEILAKKAQAKAVLERAAAQLKAILQDTAKELDPFPYFLDSDSVLGLEAEPPRTDLGCVIVCPDAELYEYTFTISASGYYPDFSRQEQLKKLDLPPHEYIHYAYTAIGALVDTLQEKWRGEEKSPRT